MSGKFCFQCGDFKILDDFQYRKDFDGYTGKCKNCIHAYQTEWYLLNKEKVSIRDSKRRSEIRKVKREYMRRKRQTPVMKIYSSVSRQIHAMLSSQKSSKSQRSFMKYVDWTLDELKKHIETQFEPWMTWQNYGKYNACTWDDQDVKTWTWQLDHIIPRSNLPYSNMNNENFKKCWALKNLRPLSAKKNVLDGVMRTRH